MKLCVYDTETTGIPAYSEPSESPNQPHLVEIAALLADPEHGIIERVSHIIKPDGWRWGADDEAFKVHGITFERAMDEGIPEPEAIYNFLQLVAKADMRVAHNENFDAKMVRIAMKRYGDGINDGDAHWSQYSQAGKDEIADRFANMPKYCTMRGATKDCRLPATETMRAKKMGHLFKNPSLTEAYLHYFGVEPPSAHRALIDAESCWDVYLAIQRHDLAAILAAKACA